MTLWHVFQYWIGLVSVSDANTSRCLRGKVSFRWQMQLGTAVDRICWIVSSGSSPIVLLSLNVGNPPVGAAHRLGQRKAPTSLAEDNITIPKASTWLRSMHRKFMERAEILCCDFSEKLLSNSFRQFDKEEIYFICWETDEEKLSRWNLVSTAYIAKRFWNSFVLSVMELFFSPY